VIRLLALFATLSSVSTTTFAETIVVWNAKPQFYEGIDNRASDYKKLNKDLKPDILVLVEVVGQLEVVKIANAMEWPEHYIAVTDFAIGGHATYSSLEVAVISKIPIVGAVEYDTALDSRTHPVLLNGKPVEEITVTELKLSSSGIPGFGSPLGHHQRGTLRVDLENGLTIFPVHLQSNRNGSCIDLTDARAQLKKLGLPISGEIDKAIESGFSGATKERQKDALMRESALAAIENNARNALRQDRVVVIAGDFNTSFAKGLAGQIVEDCELKDFGCAPTAFPASKCAGDGYDDTLSILENAITGGDKWTYLSKELDHTYHPPIYDDLAIDHAAVPSRYAEKFSKARKGESRYNSDHYPIIFEFNE